MLAKQQVGWYSEGGRTYELFHQEEKVMSRRLGSEAGGLGSDLKVAGVENGQRALALVSRFLRRHSLISCARPKDALLRRSVTWAQR